jgi:hypothetical protein
VIETRLVYLRPDVDIAADDDEQARAQSGEFAPCVCCNKVHVFGQSSVHDHQTKGDQPFQALAWRSAGLARRVTATSGRA